MVGRTSQRLCLRVARRPWAAETVGFVVPLTAAGTAVYTDDWAPYRGLPRHGRRHASVSHLRYEWARDDDGDGVREVHDNTLEGIWTGLRNFLRPMRGVSKHYLAGYVAIFEWAYNLKAIDHAFLGKLIRRPFPTKPGT